MNRLFIKPPAMIVPKVGDIIVVDLPWPTRTYKVSGVFLGGYGFEDLVELFPDGFAQNAHNKTINVPLIILQPFLQHREVIEGYQEDIERLYEKRSKTRKAALAKLTQEEKEALGL